LKSLAQNWLWMKIQHYSKDQMNFQRFESIRSNQSLEISWFFHNFSFTEIALPKRQAPSRNDVQLHILTLQWHFTFIFNNFWWTISLVIFCLFRDTIGCAKPTYSDLFRISELYCLNFYIQAPVFLSKLISYNYATPKKLIQYCATDIFIQISELKLLILELVQT
jgi:hypothetical protein